MVFGFLIMVKETNKLEFKLINLEALNFIDL